MFAIDNASTTKLEEAHYKHLLDEGFTPDEISECEIFGVQSISASESVKRKVWKWNGQRRLTDGGLWFPFHPEYGQIRLNTPIVVDGKAFKYLGPSAPVKLWMPSPNYAAITEGWKDAAKPTVMGIPTAAIVGVDNIIHCVPQGCEKPIIFDSDGWCKPTVVRALVWGALWTNGRINLFPTMPDYPTGGACEFFKSSHTISDYQDLIDGAMKPAQFLEAWVDKWAAFSPMLKADCAKVATELSYILQSPDKFIKHLENRVTAKRDEWAAKRTQE